MANSFLLIVVQQLISLWFLSDFFLARDSFASDSLKKIYSIGTDPVFERLYKLSDDIYGKHCKQEVVQQPHFDKLLFILIDALGTEFIPSIRNQLPYSETISIKHVDRQQHFSMPFLEDKIIRHKAMGFTAKAATPTVTMPRVKSLVSGTIPSFVDLIYNLARDVSKFDDDNFVKIAATRGKQVVFYGDDTWLALFDRSLFLRSKETFSFFASDYTIVDTNVTVEAIPETERNPIDWDLLILHYLGLDHIGHVFGTNEHPLFKTKLLEMDSVIQQLTSNLEPKGHKVLTIVCGDHGMNEVGNHGGSSFLESNTAMVFMPINKNFTGQHHGPQSKINQIDLAITVSVLMGLPIPRMSKGVLIEPLMRNLIPLDDQKTLPCAALANLMTLVNLTNPREFQVSEDHHDYLVDLLHRHLNYRSNDELNSITSDYFTILRKLQDRLLENMIQQSFSVVISVILVLVLVISLLNLRLILHRLALTFMPKLERLACLIVFTVPILMHGSTDFLEAEQLFWPIFTAISVSVLCYGYLYKNDKAIISASPSIEPFKVISLVATYSLCAFWKKSGCDLLRTDSVLLSTISVIILCNNIRKNSQFGSTKDGWLNFRVVSIGFVLIFSKTLEESTSYDNPDTIFHRALVQNIAFIIITANSLKSITDCWLASAQDKQQQKQHVQPLNYNLSIYVILLSFLLLRRRQFLFLISNVIMESSFNSIAKELKLHPITRALIYFNLAQTAFYNQGNTNIFSSIDVKPAFFGQVHYNLTLAVPLVAIATHSTQLYWTLKLFQRLREARSIYSMDESSQDSLESLAGKLLLLRDFFQLGYYMFVCMILRNHLFIWSVISPKLVYLYAGNTIKLLFVVLVTKLTSLQRLKQMKASNQLESTARQHQQRSSLLLEQTV